MAINFLRNGTLALALAASAGVALAAVYIDDNGYGFVGKGDVQIAFDPPWNNQQLQHNANSVKFRAETVEETTWECYNSNNDKTQERTRTTTTEGLVTSEARVKNQVTGFNLQGFDGTSTIDTEGPALNSCPSGPWSYVQGSTETTPVEGSGLEVSIDRYNWYPLNTD